MWVVDGNEYEDSGAVARIVVTEDDYEEGDFDVVLDETEEKVLVCGLEYSPADVLKNVDYSAYRSLYNDWLDGELTEKRNDAEHFLWRMYDGEESNINGHTVVYHDEEEEEDEEDDCK